MQGVDELRIEYENIHIHTNTGKGISIVSVLITLATFIRRVSVAAAVSSPLVSRFSDA
jgi:hypothetical protein